MGAFKLLHAEVMLVRIINIGISYSAAEVELSPKIAIFTLRVIITLFFLRYNWNPILNKVTEKLSERD